jgi:hypothetical protein
MHVSLASEAAPAGMGGGTNGSGPGRDNEDFVAATSDAIVLLDGAGPAPGQPSGCSHGVPWYVRSLGAVLLSELTQPTWPLTQILARAIKHVTSLHDFTCDLGRPGAPAASVVMMRRTHDAVEFLVLADAVIVLDVGVPEPLVIADQRVDAVADLYRSAAESPLAGTAEHTRALRHYQEAMRGHRDRDYWVASIDPLAAEQALTGSVPLDQVRAVALLSDGAARLVDRFELASWRQLLALLARHGAREAIRHVRAAEEAPPPRPCTTTRPSPTGSRDTGNTRQIPSPR